MMDIYENTSEYVAKNKRSRRIHSRSAIEADTEEEAADTGGRAIRPFLVGFGLLCILQAALNVGLRLFLETNCCEERNELQKMYSILNMSRQNVSEERDELQKMYSSLTTSHENLHKENGALQSMYSVLITTYQNVADERDELQKMYSFLNTTSQNVSEERDKLQEKYSFLNMSRQNVSEERDELQKMYSFLNTIYQNVSEERDKLQEKYSFLQTSSEKKSEEMNKLRTKLNNITINTASNQSWSYFEGSFYYASTATHSWEESRHFCQGNGADLVVINSREEQDFVQKFGRRRWIGLIDRETEGVWKWVDGSPYNLSFWMSGEPNDSPRGEDCAEIILSVTGKNWNDVPCDYQREWLCEL